MEKTIKIFKSFKEAEEAEVEYWRNLSGKEKLEVLDAIQFMHLKMLYPDGKEIEKVVKIKKRKRKS